MGPVEERELDALVGTHHDRKELAHEMAGASGHAGRTAAKHVLYAVMDLVEAVVESHGADSDDVVFARQELLRFGGEYTAVVAG